jgi:hypothetical protein
VTPALLNASTHLLSFPSWMAPWKRS